MPSKEKSMPSQYELITAKGLAVEWILKDQITDPSNPDYGAYWGAYYPSQGKYQEPYMETASFTLPTMVRCYLQTKDDRLLKSVNLCVNGWMKKALQYKDHGHPQLDKNAYGALKHNSYTPRFFTFDNGEAVRGVVFVYRLTKDWSQLQLAGEIAEWLIDVMQNPDGSFRTNYDLHPGKFDTYSDVKPVYHGRTAWSLLELWRETGNRKYKDAAVKALTYVKSQQRDNGWFETVGGLTEYMMYAAEGLYYSGKIMNNTSYVEAAMRTIRGFARAPHKDRGDLYEFYDENWKPFKTEWAFNSEDGQQAVMCYNLYLDKEDKEFLDEGDACLLWLYQQQDRQSGNPGTYGGIPNSVGVTDWHTRYPIWSVKYFIDAIDLKLKIISQEDEG